LSGLSNFKQQVEFDYLINNDSKYYTFSGLNLLTGATLRPISNCGPQFLTLFIALKKLIENYAFSLAMHFIFFRSKKVKKMDRFTNEKYFQIIAKRTNFFTSAENFL